MLYLNQCRTKVNIKKKIREYFKTFKLFFTFEKKTFWVLQAPNYVTSTHNRLKINLNFQMLAGKEMSVAH